MSSELATPAALHITSTNKTHVASSPMSAGGMFLVFVVGFLVVAMILVAILLAAGVIGGDRPCASTPLITGYDGELGNLHVGTTFICRPNISGGSPPFTFNIVDGGTLPDGVGFKPCNGSFFGKPIKMTTSPVSVKVRVVDNMSAFSEYSVTLTVRDCLPVYSYPGIDDGILDLVPGRVYSIVPGPPVNSPCVQPTSKIFSSSPEFPIALGIKIDGTTGELSGKGTIAMGRSKYDISYRTGSGETVACGSLSIGVLEPAVSFPHKEMTLKYNEKVLVPLTVTCGSKLTSSFVDVDCRRRHPYILFPKRHKRIRQVLL
jgi:hypothetical protein